jgi:hypothetical protein
MDEKSFLRRLSIDIRGTLPSEAEYLALENKEALEFVDDFLNDPEYFGPRVRGIFTDYYRTEIDTFLVSGADFGVSSEVSFREAVGQEPLRVIEEIAVSDLPWTELVTADWTMGNETSAQIFPLDYEGSGWKKTTYTDGRPAAGILSSNGMWWRYTSTVSNANRNRANTISRLLLCNNYLHRPILFERGLDLLDQEAIEEAISSNPSCVGCHQTLDPLAAHLFGFWAVQSDSPLEVTQYHPDRERAYEEYLAISPGYYGETSYGLHQLGQHIAGDERFVGCVVEQVSEQLLGRAISLADMSWSTPHRNTFLREGLVLRSLIRSIVSDPLYRPAWFEPDMRGSNAKLMKPAQLASVIEEKTGFVWTYQEDEMLDNDVVGLKSLSGGGQVFIEPSATYVLSVSRLVEQAAVFVTLEESQQDVSLRKFFVEVSWDVSLDADLGASARMIQRWHLILFGHDIALDGEEVQANIELWNALYSIHGESTEAWQGLLTALLRDPDFVMY